MDEKDHAILAERGGGEIHQSTITVHMVQY